MKFQSRTFRNIPLSGIPLSSPSKFPLRPYTRIHISKWCSRAVNLSKGRSQRWYASVNNGLKPTFPLENVEVPSFSSPPPPSASLKASRGSAISNPKTYNSYKKREREMGGSASRSERCAGAKDRTSSGLNGGKLVSGLFASRPDSPVSSLFPAVGTIKDRWRYSRSQQLVSWPTAKRPPGVDSILPPWRTATSCGAGPSFVSEGADASPYGADTGREAAGSFWLNVAPSLSPLVGTRLSIARPTRREDAGIDGERMRERERFDSVDDCEWLMRGWMRQDFWEELFLGWRERERRFFLCSDFLVNWDEYIYIECVLQLS